MKARHAPTKPGSDIISLRDAESGALIRMGPNSGAVWLITFVFSHCNLHIFLPFSSLSPNLCHFQKHLPICQNAKLDGVGAKVRGGVLHPLTYSPKQWHCPNSLSCLQVLSETVVQAPINVLPLIIIQQSRSRFCCRSINNPNKPCSTNTAGSLTSYCSEFVWRLKWFIECIYTHFHHW